MKKLFYPLFAAALLAVSGCRSGDPEAGGKSVEVNVMDSGARQQGNLLAEKFARGLEKSLLTGDAAHWRAVMPPQLAKSLTEANFKELQRRLSAKYGKFQRVSPLGMLDQGVVHYYLWKLHFLCKADKSAPEIPREGVIWIRIMQEKGKDTTLDYFGYMPF